MSKELPRIYLGGSITENPDDHWGNEWREWAAETYGWLDLVNPLDTEDPEKDEYTSSYYSDLVDTDLDLIDSCDAFLYYYEDYAMSIGTGQEQFYAWNMGLPIVVVYDGDPADLSPFVIAHNDCIVPNIEQAVEVLEELVADMYLSIENPSGWLDKHEKNGQAQSHVDEWGQLFDGKYESTMIVDVDDDFDESVQGWIDRDIEENKEMYQALADTPDDQ